jgi:hypothetical protein
MLVNGVLNFVAPPESKPRNYAFDPPPGVPQSSAAYESRSVAIRDVRPIAPTLSLESEGLRLMMAPSEVRSFDDEDEIRRVYYPETQRLVAAMTGASRVEIFDHTIRRRIPGARDRTAGVPRQPVHRVHVDYTVNSGPQRVRDVLPDEADKLLKRRYSVINVWRPIRGPLQDAPLAISDARTVDADDLVATDLLYPDRTGEIYTVKYNPKHRWLYAPRMTPDEVLLFKCFDSAQDGRARFVPHSAFDDPTAPVDALPRASIELRTLAFFDA